MSQRFFRSTDAVYEQVRLTLDQAWGHPKPGAQTCVEPAATAPHDSQGRVVLAVDQSFCEFPMASEMLPQLLASGAVEEIDRETYMAALPVR
jgi:hypothetical protein